MSVPWTVLLLYAGSLTDLTHVAPSGISRLPDAVSKLLAEFGRVPTLGRVPTEPASKPGVSVALVNKLAPVTTPTELTLTNALGTRLNL